MQRPAKPLESWRLAPKGGNKPEDRIFLVDPTKTKSDFTPPYIPAELLQFKDSIDGIYAEISSSIIYNDLELDYDAKSKIPECIIN